MATKILVRRGVIADLDQETLDEGELGFTTDTLGLYVGSDTATEGYVKINKTDNIEYDGNALTSATDTDNLKEAIQNIDVALNTEQDNVDTLQTDVTNITNGTTNITYDPTVSGLTATNIKAAIDEVTNITKEWSLVAEINSTNSSGSIIINSSNLGESFDNGNYDYKFVIDGFTNAPETAAEPLFRFNQDTTAGKYSFVNSLTRVGTNNTATNTLTGNAGGTGTSISTGLDLTTASNQGNITVSQIEVVVTRSNAGVSGFYGYHLRGEGSIIAAESTQTVGTTYSLSAIAHFTGSFGGTTGASLTSFDIHNLPSAGSSDSAKIRIYKRQR